SVRRGAFIQGAVLAALLPGCTYAAPVDRSGLEAAAPLADRSIAVAFPDVGRPHYLDDAFILGVLSPDGSARLLRRWVNRGVHGGSAMALRASSADPDHLLV